MLLGRAILQNALVARNRRESHGVNGARACAAIEQERDDAGASAYAHRGTGCVRRHALGVRLLASRYALDVTSARTNARMRYPSRTNTDASSCCSCASSGVSARPRNDAATLDATHGANCSDS